MDTPRKLPILLVDDDRDTGHLLVDMLSYLGIDAESVMDTEAAVRRLEARPYALVVTDFLSRTGEDAVSRLERLLQAAAPVPVGMMSGRPAPPDLLRRLAFHLLKPASAEQLVEAVAPHVSPQGEQPARRARIEAYFQALGERRWDALAELCHPEVVYHLPGDDPRFGRRVTGRPAFRDFAEQVFTAFPQARFEVPAVTWLPYGAVARYISRWQDAAGGERTHGGAVLLAFDDQDLITNIGVRTDVNSLRGLVT